MYKINLGNDLYLKGRIGWKGLSKNEYLDSSGYRIINATSLENKYINWNICGYISKERYDESPEIQLEEKDILISKDGTLGKIGYVIELGFPSTVASGVFVLRNTKKDILDTDYLYHFLKSHYFKDFISKMKADGSTINHLYQRDLSQLEIEVPDIKTQKKISSVLNNIDLKIELNNKINSELEKMAKTFYNYYFVQFDFPNKNGKPYKSSGGKMVYNKKLKREIPEDWEVKNIKDLLNVVTGKEDANFATENGKYNFFTCGEDILKCDEYKFDGKAILVAGNGNFNVKIYEGKFNAYQRTYVLIPDDEKYYTLIYIAVSNLINHFNNGSNGSIVKFIRKGDIEDIQLPLPKQGFDVLFNQLNTITKKIELNLEENQKLAELRDWLLPMLMNGQVIVK